MDRLDSCFCHARPMRCVRVLPSLYVLSNVGWPTYELVYSVLFYQRFLPNFNTFVTVTLQYFPIVGQLKWD